jgi:hypothetical protein
VVQAVAADLPRLAATPGQGLPLLRATQLLLWLTHHAPGSASMLIAARGTSRIQGGVGGGGVSRHTTSTATDMCPPAAEAIQAAASSEDPAVVAMLQPGTALLLQCVQLSEGAADLVVESASVRWVRVGVSTCL